MLVVLLLTMSSLASATPPRHFFLSEIAETKNGTTESCIFDNAVWDLFFGHFADLFVFLESDANITKVTVSLLTVSWKCKFFYFVISDVIAIAALLNWYV